MTNVQTIASQVTTAEEAKEVIATLLTQFTSQTAKSRLVEAARFAHQTVEEVANRSATNLLASYVVHKPGGEVWPLFS